MRPLLLYEDYSREEVHDIFSPDTPFTPQRGTWGMHGIVSVADRPGDFVFFVTFGQQQGHHVFDEGITEEGVLSWQSQPRQNLNNLRIRHFITHDELKNTIYLFLRTSGGRKYTYLGPLKYLSHDTERENPVYFQWQILDWNPSKEVIDRIGILLHPSSAKITKGGDASKDNLEKTAAPSSPFKRGKGTKSFQARKVRDYSEVDARNRELGRCGERLVIEYEKKSLIEEGRADMVKKVRHVSEIEGDGAGYDILSFTSDSKVKYIEVKTTIGPAETSFYVTSNELEFSKQHQEKYYLYRVYEYDENGNSGKFFVTAGKISDSFDLTPTEYRVSLG